MLNFLHHARRRLTRHHAIPGLLRACCAVALIALLMYGVDWRALPQQFAALAVWPALAAMIGLSAHFAVSPWKWQQALRMHGLWFDLPYLIRANGIGFFLNNFLPSAIGGDAYRVVSTLPSDGYRSRAISAVIVERLAGFAALVALGACGALLLLDEHVAARVFLLIAALGGLGMFASLAAIRAGWLKPLTRRIRHTWVFEAVSQNVGHLSRAGHRWSLLIAISLLFQAIAIGNLYFLFQSLGTDVSLAACALMAAAAGIATILPVSINGIGVVEGSLAGTAVALGIPYEPALTVAILVRLLVLPLSAVFGLLYVLQGSPALRQARIDSPGGTRP